MPTDYEEVLEKKTTFDDPEGPFNKPLTLKTTRHLKTFKNSTGQLADSLIRKAPLDTQKMAVSPLIKKKISKSIQDIDKAASFGFNKTGGTTRHAATQTIQSPVTAPNTPVIKEDYFSPAAVERRNRAGFGLKQKHIAPHIKNDNGTQININNIADKRTEAHKMTYKKPTAYASAVFKSKVAVADASGVTNQNYLGHPESPAELKSSYRQMNQISTPNALKSKALKLRDEYYFRKELNAKIKMLKEAHYEETGLLNDSFDNQVRSSKAKVSSLNKAYNKKMIRGENAYATYKKSGLSISMKGDIVDLKNKLDSHMELADSKKELLNIETMKARRIEDLKLKHKQEIQYLKKTHQQAFSQDMKETDLAKKIMKKDLREEKKYLKSKLAETTRKPVMGNRSFGNKAVLSKIPARAATNMKSLYRRFWRL